ncbi:MAG: 50S ribosomal protein L18 [Candidatus Curtissbacteria bacterium]
MKLSGTKKISQRLKRHAHIRKTVTGTTDIPRLVVFRSNKYLYAQIIDDTKGVTLTAISTAKNNDKVGSKNIKTDLAQAAGEKLAQAAMAKKVKKVVFDRAGYKYHGRVKALAEGARKGGLNF